jgi:hypothetical protein
MAGCFDQVADAHSGEFAQGHQQDSVASKADDFGPDNPFVLRVDETQIADASVWTHRLDNQANNLGNSTRNFGPCRPFDRGFQPSKLGLDH